MRGTGEARPPEDRLLGDPDPNKHRAMADGRMPYWDGLGCWGRTRGLVDGCSATSERERERNVGATAAAGETWHHPPDTMTMDIIRIHTEIQRYG